MADARRRAEVLADRAGFLRRQAAGEAFDVAASFIAADAASAVGFLPKTDETVPEILRSRCVRCHAANTDARLRRARFNAESIDRIDPVTATAIRRRLSLPRTSPELMPPLRVGELPRPAIARIERYLRDHCTDPGACE